MSSCFIKYLATLLLGIPVVAQPVAGRVVDEAANPIAGALVVASGGGFVGWAESANDGSFKLSAAGAFISVRHLAFKPVLIRLARGPEPIAITLEKADATVRRVPACGSLENAGRAWIGGGLRVRPPESGYDGPQYGEHDSHWYVKSRGSVLHIVDGYAWHAGLPVEKVLTSALEIRVGGWTFENIVGLDLSGSTANGKRWRWVGAPVADAIEYNDADDASAQYFDKIIESMCFHRLTP